MFDNSNIHEQEEVTKILKELAVKCNMSLQDMRELIRTEFQVVSENIRNTEINNENTYDYARLPLFGVFCVDKAAIKKINKKELKKIS